MAWKVRSPRDFVLGVIALAGAVVTGILLSFVGAGGPGPPTLPGILALIIGAFLLIGGIALLTKGIQGPAAVVLGVALLGAAVVIGVVASAVQCGGTDPWCWAGIVTAIVLSLGGISLLVVGFGGAEVGRLYRLPLMIAGGLLLISGLFVVSLLGVTGVTASSVRFILAGVGAVLLVVPLAIRQGKTTISS